jgi:hydroxylamine reductase
VGLIKRCVEMREQLKAKVRSAEGRRDFTEEAANFKPAPTLDELLLQGRSVGLKSDPSIDPDILSPAHASVWRQGRFGLC